MSPPLDKKKAPSTGERISEVTKAVIGRRGDLVPGIRVPFSLIGPLWSVLAAVAGLWYSNERARSDQAIEAVALRKDVATLVMQVSEVRDTLATYYPRNEAVRDAAIIDLKLQQIDKRVTTLEAKSK